MKIRKLTALLYLSLFFICAPAARAWIFIAPEMQADRPKNLHPLALTGKKIVVAENDPQATENGNPSANENGKQAMDSESNDQEKSGRKADGADEKSIKPFKPSEEIAAEQAVDYPVDI